MLTLIVRFFDVLMIIGGIVLSIVGAGTLVGKTEEAPTEVSIAALERGEKPNAKWLRISDGELFFPATAKDVRIKKSGQKSDGEGYYIPMGSRDQIIQWTLSAIQDQRSLKNCKVLVFVDRSVVAEKWPQMLSGSPPTNPGTFVAEGTIVVGNDASSKVKKHYTEGYKDLNLDELNVLSHGDKPLQKGGAAAMLGAGVGLIILGIVIWRIKRRRHGAAVAAPAWGAPPSGGIPPGYSGTPGYPPTSGYPPALEYPPAPQQQQQQSVQAPPPFPPRS